MCLSNIDSFVIILIITITGGQSRRRFTHCRWLNLTVVFPYNDSDYHKTGETDDQCGQTVVEQHFRVIDEERAFDELGAHLEQTQCRHVQSADPVRHLEVVLYVWEGGRPEGGDSYT